MILLDTNICVATLKQDKHVAYKLLQNTGRIYLPFVVSAELYFGVEKLTRRGQAVERLRERIDIFHDTVDGVLSITPEVLQVYARLRAILEANGQPIGANDTWIAAQALAENALLVSDNTDEFSRVPELRLENWLRN